MVQCLLSKSKQKGIKNVLYTIVFLLLSLTTFPYSTHFPKLSADVCPSSNPDVLPLVLLIQWDVTSSVPEQGYLDLTSNNKTISAAMDQEQTLCLALFTAYFLILK